MELHILRVSRLVPEDSIIEIGVVLENPLAWEQYRGLPLEV